MSHSRNSNSVQSQTELTDEDSDDDGEQTYPGGKRLRCLPNKKYPQGIVRGNTRKNERINSVAGHTAAEDTTDDSESDHDSKNDDDEDSESSDSGGSSDSELDSYDSEDGVLEIDEGANDSEDGEDDYTSDCESTGDCELCCQANECKANRKSASEHQKETLPNGSSLTSSNSQKMFQANDQSFGSPYSVRCKQVQSYPSETKKSVNLYPVRHWMVIGKTVFVRWTTGLYYLGVIEKIEDDRGLCLVRYEDDSQYWTHFKDIHTQLSANTILSDSDIICGECRDGSSKSPNEIVICDVCNQGYHQLCHKPQIPDSVLEPDAPWTCRTCLYALGAREGGAERDTAVGEAMKLTKTIFHYDLSSLHWNDLHTSNWENIYCYCGGPGRYHSRMLQCHQCLQWFHEACIQEIDSTFLYGDHFYKFTCGVCNKGNEIVERLAMRWSDLVAIVLYNLCLKHQKRFFDFSTEILPFVVKNKSKFFTKGDNLKKMYKGSELSSKVLAVLKKYKKKFMYDRDREMTHWTLRVPWPFIRPQFFAPKSFWSNCDNRKTQSNNNNNDYLQSNHSIRSRSPPAFPLIYGACRKGASIYPKPARHLVRHRERKRSRRKSQEKETSIPCLPGTSNSSHGTTNSGSSCDAPDKRSMSASGSLKEKPTNSSSSTSSSAPNHLGTDTEGSTENNRSKEHLKTRIKITSTSATISNYHSWKNKRPRSELKVQQSTDCLHNVTFNDNSDDEDNRDTGTVDACLEKVIPLPENFDGQNNPFFDINGQTKSPTSSTTTSTLVNNASDKATNRHSSSRITNPNETNHHHHHHHHHNNNNNSHQSESGYQIIRSGTCSKLTLKRITGQPVKDKESPKNNTTITTTNPNTNNSNKQSIKSPVHEETSNDPSPRKCIIKAQRLTADGKLEYLLEWE